MIKTMIMLIAIVVVTIKMTVMMVMVMRIICADCRRMTTYRSALTWCSRNS